MYISKDKGQASLGCWLPCFWLANNGTESTSGVHVFLFLPHWNYCIKVQAALFLQPLLFIPCLTWESPSRLLLLSSHTMSPYLNTRDTLDTFVVLSFSSPPPRLLCSGVTLDDAERPDYLDQTEALLNLLSYLSSPKVTFWRVHLGF